MAPGGWSARDLRAFCRAYHPPRRAACVGGGCFPGQGLSPNIDFPTPSAYNGRVRWQAMTWTALACGTAPRRVQANQTGGCCHIAACAGRVSQQGLEGLS